MYGTVLMALGWGPSIAALLHLWRRRDFGHLRFARSHDWKPVPLLSFEEDFEPRFDGSGTVSPTYSYSYGGTTYQGSRLNFLELPWYASDHDFDDYSKRAFVNPENPKESVLQRELPYPLLWWGATSAVMACAGAWLLASGWRNRTPTEAP